MVFIPSKLHIFGLFKPKKTKNGDPNTLGSPFLNYRFILKITQQL